jgi:ketosteroid isomerase-like protein
MRYSVALAMCLLAACRSGEAAHSEPRAIDREKEEQAIRDRERDWRSILGRRDTAGIGAFYTEDAIYSPHGTTAYRGRDAVSARWAREFQTPDFKLERTPIRIEIAGSGDLASEVGTCDVEFRVNNRVQRPSCTYMTTWRKTDRGWKMASYIWNGDTTKSRR